jgi:hypothetical protein
MKSHPWSRIPLLAAAVFALASCGKTSSLQSPAAGGGTPAESNEAQIARALQEAPDFVQEDLTSSSLPLVDEASGGFAAIEPLRFWREIRNVQTELQTVFLNPDANGRPLLAIVTIHRALSGTFNIAAREITGPDTTIALVRKPLADDWTRRIALIRRPIPNDTGLTRWRLAGTSGVDVRTRDGVTRLLSLRIEAPGVDTTITDPLELHRLRRILRIADDVAVKLTATTLAPDDVVLFHGRDLRRRFVNNGDGTHTFMFRSGQFQGPRHFGVDALSHGTLFDDTAAYDSNAWVFPYAVVAVLMPSDDGGR